MTPALRLTQAIVLTALLCVALGGVAAAWAIGVAGPNGVKDKHR